jgi:hypothetical protein
MHTKSSPVRLLARLVVLISAIAFFPAAAFAQSMIAGVVNDSSGAVLPGVLVEAASDVLIEKVRSSTTDANGQYRIVDLRPGVYTVTFTLTGFNTVKREAVNVAAEVVVSVNADLPVGALQETITVTGETPVVDIQSAKRTRTIDSELIQSIPTARSYNGLVRMIPSMTGGGNDVVLSPGMIVFGSRGGRANEGRVQVDGLNTGASLNGGGVSGYRQDLENATEVAVTTSGGLGEAEVGGIAMNIVPRTGGNNFTAHVFATGFNQSLRASNFTQRIQDAGLNAPAETNYNYDTSFSSGGPIKRDRLWYFTQTYYRGSSSDISMFFNKNAGDITKWTYEADPTRQAQNVGNGPLQPNLRLSIQLSRRDKLNLFWDEQISNNSVGQGSSTTAPETGSWNHGWQRVQQVKWTSTASNRLLLEAGLGTYLSNWNGRERPNNDRRLIQVVEQCTSGLCAVNGGQAITYRGQATWNADWIGAHTWNAAASYITGTHNMKFGYQGAWHVDNRNAGGVPLTYRVNNGIPNRFTQQIRDYQTAARVRYNAFYAQDSWTRQRLTLSGGIRYDNAWDFYPEQQIGGTTFLPEVTRFSSSKGVEGYHDVTPRMGAVYDLFGNGKTALKFNAGRYLEAAVNANGNYSGLVPANRIVRSTNRTWTDANNNFVVDCNLYDQNANDARATGGDFCGLGDLNFGKSNPTLFYDPAVMKGWGVRPADWQLGVTVQHEILPRVSLEVGYARRWLQNFTVTDNQLTTLADYGRFSITAPADDRLPNGGGYVITDLFNVNPDKSGQTSNYRTYAPNYGKQYSIYNGVELSVQARLRGGLQLQAGSSTGETVTDNCEIRAKVPEISLLDPFCHNAPGITTRATGAATYTIPRIDVLLGATFQSSPAGSLSAEWQITAAGAPAQWAAIQQQLGRPLSANATSITVDLLQPGEMRGERVNQIDFRVGKRLNYGRMRSTLSVDMFNLLNPDTVLGNSSTFVPGVTTGLSAWNRPTQVMTPRTVKITFQHDF